MKNDLREVVRRVAVHVLGGPCQVTDQVSLFLSSYGLLE